MLIDSPRTITPRRIANTILDISVTLYRLIGNLLMEFIAHIHAAKITNDLKRITRCALTDREKTSLDNGIVSINANSV
jgi:hypothetical protein